MDFKTFMDVPDDCRGTDFWMLNDKLDDNELIDQLKSMKKQGISSVIVRTYIGHKSDYPGHNFMKKMQIVVNTAKEIGMKLFMQAKYMPEAVLGLPEKYMLKDIKPFKKGDAKGKILCSHGDYDYCLILSERILNMLDKESVDYYIKECYEDMWKDFRTEFGNTIVSVWVDEPSYRKVHLPWSDRLPEIYENLFLKPFPYEKIYLLFEDGDGAYEMRYRFWRTVLYMLTSSYFNGISDWCHKNNLFFSGHLMLEDTMETQINATCFTMPCYKYFDIPGIDNLETSLNWKYGKIKSSNEKDFYWRNFGSYNTPFQCTSVAHQSDKKKILCEMYGVSSDNLNLRDQKSIFDHFAALGINHRAVHGLFYSLRGRGKRAYPPHINYYQPYFEEYHNLTDTVARESYFLRQGTPQRDTLLLHPMDSAFCLYHGHPFKNPALKRYDTQFNETLRFLVSIQNNFELGDEDSIAYWGSVTEDAEFKIGKMSYKNVILPNCMNIRSTTVDLLEKFIKAGGNVIIFGKLPEMIDGENSADEIKTRLNGTLVAKDNAELAILLNRSYKSYSYEFKGKSSNIEIFYSQENDEKYFFIANADRFSESLGTIKLNGNYRVEVLNPFNGSVEDYSALNINGLTEIPLEIPAGGNIMLFLKPGNAKSPIRCFEKYTYVFSPNEFSLKCQDKNALLLEMFRYKKDDGEFSLQAYPIKAIQKILSDENFSGKLTLECEFENDCTLNAKLALENPEKQKLYIDGDEISSLSTGFYIDKAFETVNLPVIGKGKHKLRVERFFEPLGKPTMTVTSLFEDLGGVELEQMFIVGDFSVKSQIEPTNEPLIRLNPHFIIATQKGSCSTDITSSGYPFYCGRAVLSTELNIGKNEVGNDFYISFETVYAGCGEVYANGIFCGKLLWNPYEIKLKGLKEGKNKIEIKLFGTLRNTLGPWHRIIGEIGSAWGDYTCPDLPWLGQGEIGDKPDLNWFEDRIPDRDFWTESYLLLPFGVEKPSIYIKETKERTV